MPQVQFQSVKQKQIPVQRVQKKTEIPQLQLVQEAMPSESGRMTLEKDFRRARYSQSGCCRDCQRNRQSLENRVSPARDSRYHPSRLDQAGNGDAGESRSPQNVRRSCRVKETSRAISIWHDEGNKSGTVLNNSYQFKIPAHMLNRNRSAQDITVVYDVTSKDSFNNEKI